MDAFYRFLVKKFVNSLLNESVEEAEAENLCQMLANWTPSSNSITPTGGMAFGTWEFHDLAATVCGKKPAAWLMSWKWKQKGQHRLLDAMLAMAEKKGAVVRDAGHGIIVAKSPDIAEKLYANLQVVFAHKNDKDHISGGARPCVMAHKNIGLLLGYPEEEVDKMFPELGCEG